MTPIRRNRSDPRDLSQPERNAGDGTDPIEIVFEYHSVTKHRPQRYANGPGYLDWANQPDPFRSFADAPEVLLPFAEPRTKSRLDDLAAGLAAHPVTVETVSWLFERSLAISAWKAIRDNRWALRCNPSSGNLHPTEAYALLPALDGIANVPAVHHYRSKHHAIERRCSLSAEQWSIVTRSLPDDAFIFGLSSVIWREAWKYGERAFRYCQHDVGHALATVRYAAATLGWHVALASHASDDDVSAMLGLDRASDFADAEPEHPDLLVVVVPGSSRPSLGSWPNDEVIAAVRSGSWQGRASRLSDETVRWDAIEAVVVAAHKAERSATAETNYERPWRRGDNEAEPDAVTLILRRRSAVDFDGQTPITAAQFFRIMDRTLPRRHAPPLDVLDGVAAVHLAVFVHRVVGLEPGLYMLVRTDDALEPLRAAMDPEFEWARVEAAPDGLPLYRLAPGDTRNLARAISCGQDIAADGAFSLGMIAEFEAPIRAHGAWFYRRLFWETGMIGQVLYLEAEAAGVRATGIGCFFDDSMHQLLRLEGCSYQSLYHLAVGTPVDDPRITTLPPYEPRRG